MEKRICGLEHEYGLIFSAKGHRPVSNETALLHLFVALDTQRPATSVFLSNGGRLYQDTGSHPEYSTPECTNARDVVIYDRAGERILEALRQRAQKMMSQQLPGRLCLYKNNTDSVGNTYGCHENYLIDRRCDFPALADKLIPFLVTRQIFTGAGQILKSGGTPRYVISQRAQYIYQRMASVTTNSRSIVNTRDEPHADPSRFRRLHLIVGDSNMSQVSTYLKTGTACIVLSLIESGNMRRDLSLLAPVQAIKQVSSDPECRRPIKLYDGSTITPLEVQRIYLEAARRHYADGCPDPVTADVLDRWEAVLDAIERDPMSLDRQIDWVIKKKILDSYCAKHETTLRDPRCALIDLQYHDISLAHGIYYLLEKQGKVETIATEREIERAVHEPPQDTRARLRSMFIKHASKTGRPFSVDWAYVRFNDRVGSSVVLKDPFNAENERLESLLSHL